MRQGAPYDLVVIDEIHSHRRYDAARTRAVMEPGGAWEWGRQFWGLSGTPIVNSAADLWPFVWGPLRRPIMWYDWGLKFCEEMRPDGFGAIKAVGLKNQEELADFLRPHILRRTLAGIGVELPPLTTNHFPVDVDPAALATVMADLEGWTPQRLATALDEKDELHDSALARVRKALGMAKVPAIAEYARLMIADGRGPAVVFFQHTAVREMLFDLLSVKAGHKVSWIDGKITRKQLEAAETRFQAGKLDVLLVQTDAGGVGLTLTRANKVIVAELPWTSVGMWQAVKRVHRITQTREVRADVIRASDCWLEQSLATAVSRKHAASERLLTLIESRV